MGLVVVPIFGGYDLRRRTGRLWDFDVTGGRYEEQRVRRHRLGEPARRHRRQARLPRRTCDRDAAVDLVCRALWEAADADSATGGPDALRGIYPIVATVTADGFSRVADAELAEKLRGDRRGRARDIVTPMRSPATQAAVAAPRLALVARTVSVMTCRSTSHPSR